jgi:hypothetical protein
MLMDILCECGHGELQHVDLRWAGDPEDGRRICLAGTITQVPPSPCACEDFRETAKTAPAY